MDMTSERIEWVEIIEPRTKEPMYANLKTGECVWDPPEGVRIKRTESSQWWELFDTNTQRFYYYNATTQATVWHRPNNCDIIPLSKLQTLKQNIAEPSEKKDGYTQTSHSRVKNCCSNSNNRNDIGNTGTGGHHRHHSRVQSAGSSETRCSSELLSSPHGRHSYRLPTVDLPMGEKLDSSKYCRHSQGGVPSGSRSGNKHKDSGKSSDSSLSSAHGYKRLQEGGSLRIGSSHHRTRHSSDNRYQQNYPHPKLSYSISNSSDLGALSPTHSANTPILKKKLSSDNSLHGNSSTTGNKRDSGGSNMALKHQSFDCSSGNAGIISLTRSGSFMSSPTSHHSQIQPQQQQQLQHNRKGSADGNGASGGGGSDDSMHEKYFKSVENTPITRRRHNASIKSPGSKKNSSDSSPQSPISPQNHNNKSAKPSVLNSLSSLEPPPNICYNVGSSRNSDPDFLNLDLTVKPEKYLDKMKFDKRSPNTFVGGGGNSGHQLALSSSSSPLGPGQQQRMNNILMRSPSGRGGSSGSGGGVETSSNKHSPAAASSHYPNEYNLLGSLRNTNTSLDQYLNKTKDGNNKHVEKSSSKRDKGHQHHHAPSSDVEYDNGNISPLYSNWDQDDHLLPLKHYIIEQAKLSGCYSFGDPLDSDSFHSEEDSQSEHSFSGHEPDNEDSDHSDGHGDYLTHSYGFMDDYVSQMGDGVSYYNYMGFNRDDREDNISANVEAILESERDNTKMYSPIQQHYPPSYHFYSQANKQTHSLQRPHNQSQSPQQQQHQIKKIPSPNHKTHQVPGHLHQKDSSTANESRLKHQQLQQHQQQKQQQQQQRPTQQKQQQKDQDESLSVIDNRSSSNNHHSHNQQSQHRHQKPLPSLPFSPPAGPLEKIRREGGAGIVGIGGVPQLAIMKECDIEKFAQDNLNLHSKGIFRKKSSVRDMLSWTSDAISRPMLALARDKAGKKLATELFKFVQIYMGDRKARAGMSLNSVAIDIIVMALGQQQLRDELYVQLCRQTTENPKRESLIRGWELMAICLSFVPPSPTFQPALLNYMNRHRDPTFATSFPEVGKWPIHVQISHYATVCCRRLDRIGSSGRRQAKKPTEDEIEQARTQILRDSMFGNTLNEVMELQKDKYPDRKLPWIQVTLSEQVLLLNGKQTEGIFRVSADVDEVNALKARLDRWEVPEHKNTMDAHAPASLLKLWYRELYDPLIPDELYDECVRTEDPDEANRIIAKLPELNKLVLTYLVNFLQQFSQPDVVSCTKMDSSNLAMVFAPNCLRCTSQDPKVILENARKEMAFMRTLIQYMDTSNVENLI